MDTLLSSRTAIVTGASGRIGSAIVQSLRREGVHVVAQYRNTPPPTQATNNALTETNVEHTAAQDPASPRLISVQADVTQESEVDWLFVQTAQDFGLPEILIICAGKWIREDVPIWEMSVSQWQDTLAVNLTSVFFCVRRFLQGVRDFRIRRPAIVLVGSTSALYGEPGHCDYAASKSALAHGFLRSVMNEITQLCPQGRINVVSPGWDATRMAAPLLQNKDDLQRTLQTVPLRKIASPQDVANTVVFLASHHLAGHITGEVAQVSGGREAGLLYSDEEVDLEARE